MLYEQAFMSLPEFLTGFPYKGFDYEGTLMSAFSMAVLQELNGRNINNPISCLRSEVTYPAAPGKRADIHLDLAEMKILTPELKQYGVYQHNWLEAKYFRLNENGKPTVDSLKVVLLLLKDIIRLVTLPPENSFPDSEAARFLLHAYQGEPKTHIAEKKNSRKNGSGGVVGFTRSWAKKIRSAGIQTIDTIHANNEVNQFDAIIGAPLRKLDLTLNVTNLVYEPRNAGNSVYWCYLTRIDDFKVSLENMWYERKDGTLTESEQGARDQIVASVVAGLAP